MVSPSRASCDLHIGRGARRAALARLEVASGNGHHRVPQHLDPQAHERGLDHGCILVASGQEVAHPRGKSVGIQTGKLLAP